MSDKGHVDWELICAYMGPNEQDHGDCRCPCHGTSDADQNTDN